MSLHPSMKWAQRSDRLLITIELPDAQNVKLKLDPEGKFHFSATSGADKIPYEINLDLLGKVNVDDSKECVGSRIIRYIIMKAQRIWWTRLLKQKGKPPGFLTVDWNNWVDEDEEIAKKFRAPPGWEFNFDFHKPKLGNEEELDGGDPDDDSDMEEENSG